MELFRLYLPVLFPSWRFFAEVGASPRVEFRVGQGPWRDAMDRPERLSVAGRVTALFWNARWNQALFLAACAERYAVERKSWLLQEITARLVTRFELSAPPELRISFVTPQGTEVFFQGRTP